MGAVVPRPVVVQRDFVIPLPPGEAVGLGVAPVVLRDAEGRIAVVADGVAVLLRESQDAPEDIRVVEAGTVGAALGQRLIYAGAVGLAGQLSA